MLAVAGVLVALEQCSELLDEKENWKCGWHIFQPSGGSVSLVYTLLCLQSVMAILSWYTSGSMLAMLSQLAHFQWQ